jgi:hypothetical protein
LQWSVTCPKWSSALHQNTFHSWALQPHELAKVNKDFNAKAITCKVCSSAFSLIEGVKESFVSEHPFLIHDYQSNIYDSGMMKGKVGLAVFVTFSKHFDMKPEVYITPTTPSLVVASNVTTKGFYLHASKTEETASDDYECG